MSCDIEYHPADGPIGLDVMRSLGDTIIGSPFRSAALAQACDRGGVVANRGAPHPVRLSLRHGECRRRVSDRLAHELDAAEGWSSTVSAIPRCFTGGRLVDAIDRPLGTPRG